MNILFTLCGRAGSKGLHNKNILPFCGYPLPYYSLAVVNMFRAAHTGEYYHIDLVLSTDSAELTRLVAEIDKEALLVNRDASLAGDRVRKIDVIRDAARRAAAHFDRAYDMVVDLDLTSPLRTLRDLENVIDKRLHADADVIYTVTPARRNPYFNQVTRHKNGYFSTVCESTFASRQEAPDIYDMNASIYAYTPAFIDGSEPLFRKADIVVMRDTGVLDIDGPEDHQLMQVIAAWFFDHDEGYASVQDVVMVLDKNQKTCE